MCNYFSQKYKPLEWPRNTMKCQYIPWENKWSRWAHGELTVTTVVTTLEPNDHGSVTARRGHSSVTARSQLSHSSVTARSQLNHGIFSMITAQSRLGHSSITAQVTAQSRLAVTILVTVSSPRAHGEQSRWPIFFSWDYKRQFPKQSFLSIYIPKSQSFNWEWI